MYKITKQNKKYIHWHCTEWIKMRRKKKRSEEKIRKQIGRCST